MDAEFLGELRSRFLEDAASDARRTAIFDKIVGRLSEDPDEADLWETGPSQGRTMSEIGRQWDMYVIETLDSIEKRAQMKDTDGNPRVSHVYRTGALKRSTDLNDYLGRHRVRVLYNAMGQAVEIILKAPDGSVVTEYNRASFDPNSDQAPAAALSAKYDTARRATVKAKQNPDQKQLYNTRGAVEGLLEQVMDTVSGSIAAQEKGSKSTLPELDDLEKMSLEQVLDHLEKLG
mmetsp:Transcript_120899/g.277212  ORF Transcript_120899/g.277212 Transcript_120899/m.277212 type:complete len:233 (-) Transcript_120899:155-853(-)